MEPIYLSREALAWMAAAEKGGMTLPKPVADAVVAWQAADVALKALEQPEAPTSSARLVDQGYAPADALAEVDRQVAAVAEWRREQGVLIDARSRRAHDLNRVVDTHLEDLVLAARPTVTEIVEDARPHVEKLARFGPAFDANVIVARATAAELKSFQTVTGLQLRLDAIHKAWSGGYMTPARISSTYELSYNPAEFGWSADAVAREHYYWENAGLVREPRLNGRALSRSGRPLPPSTSLLLIAAEDPECGYRLAVLPEIRERALAEWQAMRDARPPVNRQFRARSI